MGYLLNGGFGSAPLSTTVESSIGTGLLQAAGLLATNPVTAVAAPFVALGGAIAEMLASFGVGSGCGQTCVLSAQFANQAESYLQQNIDKYMALAIPRPQSAQTAALANFDTIWSWLVQNCSNPQLGTAGQRCISDRQAGSCVWTQPANKVPAWGTPAAGACWNWWNGYRDPIANDPNVVPDSALASAVDAAGQVVTGGLFDIFSTGTSSDVSSLTPLLLLAAAVGLVVWLS